MSYIPNETKEEAKNWARSFFNKKDIKIEDISHKSYSSVFKIKNEENTYSLKINSTFHPYEPQLSSYLNSLIPNSNLHIISINEKLNCFIAEWYDAIPADEYLKETQNENLVFYMMEKYFEIQKSVDLKELRKINIRDLSTEVLVEQFFKHIQNSSFSNQYNDLIQFKNLMENDAQIILNYGVIDSLEHGDFHLGNILLGKHKALVFLDFAEATIANPFFSLISYIYSLERRLKIHKESYISRKVTFDYLRFYSQFLNIKKDFVEESFVLSQKLYDLYYVICMIQLLEHDRESKKWNDRVQFHINKIKENYS